MQLLKKEEVQVLPFNLQKYLPIVEVLKSKMMEFHTYKKKMGGTSMSFLETCTHPSTLIKSVVNWNFRIHNIKNAMIKAPLLFSSLNWNQVNETHLDMRDYITIIYLTTVMECFLPTSCRCSIQRLSLDC